MDFVTEDFVPHFIYCGDYYLLRGGVNRLEAIFLEKMRCYGIKNAILTRLGMIRLKLVTGETVKKAYQGKLKNDEDWVNYDGSIHDDLETFFCNLQDQKTIKIERGFSFFTPQLTEEELKLLGEKK